MCARYLEAIGANPGLEFKVAMEEASARNAKIVLGDQPADVTMRKLSDAMSIKQLLAMMMTVQVDRLKHHFHLSKSIVDASTRAAGSVRQHEQS